MFSFEIGDGKRFEVLASSPPVSKLNKRTSMKKIIKHLEGKYTLATSELIINCTDEELRMYLYLKLYALEKNNAFPGYRIIAEELNWSGGKVKRTYEHMVEKNRLVVYKGNGKSNLYDITWYDKINIKGQETKRVRNRLGKSQSESVTGAELLIDITSSNEEDNIQTKSLKTEKYPKSWYREITDFHLALVQKREGYKPKSNYGQATTQLKELFKEEYTIEQIKGLVEFYVCSKKFSEIGASITNCFTPHSINAWLQKGSPKSSYNL